MKALYILMVLIFCSAITKAQDYKYVYYLDKNFASVDERVSLFIGKGYQGNALFSLDGFSRIDGRLFFKMHFTDSTLSNMQGLYQGFYPNGEEQSEGNYENSMEQGSWIKWDSTGLKTDSIVYDKGKEIVTESFLYNKAGLLQKTIFYDSITKKGTDTYYSEHGIKEREIQVAGDSAVAYYYQNGALSHSQRLKTAEKKEAMFPGGDVAFGKFLTKNLDGSVAENHRARPGIYTAFIRFVIDKTGAVINVEAETNIGYGIEEEGIRVIKRCPNWIPASEYGEFVIAYRRQPITFIVSGD